MAGSTRLELATSGVTGRRSNQLNYDPDLKTEETKTEERRQRRKKEDKDGKVRLSHEKSAVPPLPLFLPSSVRAVFFRFFLPFLSSVSFFRFLSSVFFLLFSVFRLPSCIWWAVQDSNL